MYQEQHLKNVKHVRPLCYEKLCTQTLNTSIHFFISVNIVQYIFVVTIIVFTLCTLIFL